MTARRILRLDSGRPARSAKQDDHCRGKAVMPDARWPSLVMTPSHTRVNLHLLTQPSRVCGAQPIFGAIEQKQVVCF